MNYRNIEIDFDVSKAIEGARTSFADSPNDVLRRIFGLPQADIDAGSIPVSLGRKTPWVDKGVTLPHGTLLEMDHLGRHYEGYISNGQWVVNGHVFSGPSAAASATAVTRAGKTTQLNGWLKWRVRRPDDQDYRTLASLRRS